MTRLSAVGWRAFLVAALTMFVVPSAALATPTFLTPATISDPGQDAFEPQVAMMARATRTLSGRAPTNTNFRIQYSTRTPAGAWSVPQTLSDPGQGASSPIISVDPSGNAVAVWTRSDGTDLRIQAAYKAGGRQLSALPVTVSAAGGDASAPQVSMDNDRQGARRMDAVRRNQAAHPGHRASAGAGGAFGAITTLSAAGQDAFEPRSRRVPTWTAMPRSAGPARTARSRLPTCASSARGGVTWSDTRGPSRRRRCACRWCLRTTRASPEPRARAAASLRLVQPADIGRRACSRSAARTPTASRPTTTGAVKYRVISGNLATESRTRRTSTSRSTSRTCASTPAASTTWAGSWRAIEADGDRPIEPGPRRRSRERSRVHFQYPGRLRRRPASRRSAASAT